MGGKYGKRKRGMLKRLWVIILSVFILQCVSGLYGNSSLTKASDNSERMEAFTEYKKMLLGMNDKTNIRFWIADLDDDGIDTEELVIQRQIQGNISCLDVFRYRNGEMETVSDGSKNMSALDMTRMGFYENPDGYGMKYSSGVSMTGEIFMGTVYLDKENKIIYTEEGKLGTGEKNPYSHYPSGEVYFKDGVLTDDTYWGPLDEVTVEGDKPKISGNLPERVREFMIESGKTFYPAEENDSDNSGASGKSGEDDKKINEESSPRTEIYVSSGKDGRLDLGKITVMDKDGKILEGKALHSGRKETEGNLIFDCSFADTVKLSDYGLNFKIPEKWKGKALIMLTEDSVDIIPKLFAERSYQDGLPYIISARGFRLQDKEKEPYYDSPNSIYLFTEDFTIDNRKRSDYPGGEELNDKEALGDFNILLEENTAADNKKFFSFDDNSKGIFVSREAALGENKETEGNTTVEKVKNAVLQTEKAYAEMSEEGQFIDGLAPILARSAMKNKWLMEIRRHRDSGSVFDFVSADDFEITSSDDGFGTVSYTSAIRGQSTGTIYKSRMHLDFTVENGTVYFFNETEEDIE